MRFGMLGPLTVDSDGGTPLPVSPALPRTALAMLVANANTTVSAERFIGAMWPQNPPAAALASLYTHMTRLRHLLGAQAAGRIRTTVSGYLLQAERHEVDLTLFHEYHRLGLSAHRAGEWETARRELTAALALWRGEPLADIARPVLGASEQHRLRELRLQALQWRIEAELQLGLYEGVLAELQALAVEYRYLEAFHGQLMLALYGVGRHADALEAYARLRRTLAEELGTEPDNALRELRQRILLRDPELLVSVPGPHVHEHRREDCPHRAWEDAAREDPATAHAGQAPGLAVPEAAPWVVPCQLPPETDELTGRTEELQLLREWLARSGPGDPAPVAAPGPAVAVLSGVAGVGKSALARHAARLLADRFPDGLLLVDLGASGARPADPTDVLARLLRDLGVEPSAIPGDPQVRAARYRDLLAGRRVLLVLDDAADAAQVEPLLPGTPGCAVLVTSRSRSSAPPGAHRLPLAGLPPQQAAALLAGIVGDRRAAAEPEALRRVLAACEGLPLALYLAGMRLAARPSWQIAAFAELLEDPDRRLDELAVGESGVRAAFQSGYRALASRSPEGATAALVFRLAGLWQGADLSLPAVAALADADETVCARALETLVDSHLLRSPAPGRYCVQGLLGLFATETALALDPPALRAEALHRLVSWYHHSADAAVNALDGQCARPDPGPADRHRALRFTSPGQALHWQRTERANLIAAVFQADVQGLHSFAWLSATTPPGGWYRSDRSDQGSAADAGPLPPLTAADPTTEPAIGRPTSLSQGLGARAERGRRAGRAEGGGTGLRTSVEHAHPDTQPPQAPADLVDPADLLAQVAELVALGRYPQALAGAQEALARGTAAGRRSAVLAARGSLAEVLRITGRYAEAEFHAESALELAQSAGDAAQEASTRVTLGHIRCAYRDFDRALAFYREGLALVADRDEPQCAARCLEAIGDLHAGRGMMDEARDAWQSAITVLRQRPDLDGTGTTPSGHGR
jgi:DNA-binding SARP family transcriptional activator